MKKILFLLITVIGIYLIYLYFSHTSINYLSISDNVMIGENNYNNYIYEYLHNKKKLNEFNSYFTNYTISLIYQDIKNNRTIRVNNNDYYFKKSLRESDFVVISIGMEELSNNYNKYDMNKNYKYFDKMYFDIEKLVKEIKKYAQEKVIFLGFYNPTNYYDAKTDEFFYDIDIRLNRLMINNNITYIDLYELIKGNNYKEKNSVYLNSKAHQKIANIIEFYIDK